MKITIIGFGNMGQAFGESLARNLRNCTVFVSDPRLKSGAKLKFGNLKVDLDMTQLPISDFVILAVKPKDLLDLSLQIKDRISKHSILVSIAAGVNMAKIKKIFQHEKIVRCMPNLAIKNNQGIIGWITMHLTEKEKTKVKNLLDSIAVNFEVKGEHLIDAVTAISGSGPAYFFLLSELLYKSALRLGFNEKQADLLVTKTLVGAGAIKESQPDIPYDELIEKIASKKGTTEAALKYFSKKGFGKIVEGAVKQAHNRAKEISHE